MVSIYTAFFFINVYCLKVFLIVFTVLLDSVRNEKRLQIYPCDFPAIIGFIGYTKHSSSFRKPITLVAVYTSI